MISVEAFCEMPLDPEEVRMARLMDKDLPEPEQDWVTININLDQVAGFFPGLEQGETQLLINGDTMIIREDYEHFRSRVNG